jgi:hypothetical protein
MAVAGYENPNPMNLADRPSSEVPSGPVQLRNWPLVDQPGISWPVLVGEAVLGIILARTTGSTAVGFFSAAALISATWRLWVPVVFIVRPDGLVERVLGRSFLHPWREVISVERAGVGVVVTVGPAAGRAHPVGQIYIHGGAQIDRFLNQIDAWMPATSTVIEPSQGGSPPV